jgi:hypothetical protein
MGRPEFAINSWQATLFGLLLSTITTLGDLGEHDSARQG